MREFVLVDLRLQMPYLPQFMRHWTRQQVLDWLGLYGEIMEPDIRHTLSAPAALQDVYFFRSWCGLETAFVLRASLEMSIPSSLIHAWEGVAPQ